MINEVNSLKYKEINLRLMKMWPVLKRNKSFTCDYLYQK